MFDDASMNLLRIPGRNKGSSFTQKERSYHSLDGVVPPCDPISLPMKVQLVLEEMRGKCNALEKNLFLSSIQDSDETLFYALLHIHTEETLPIVYTPTVGEICQRWSRLYQCRERPRGLYLSLREIGRVKTILQKLPNKVDIRVIVFTDGERILGLGDLGANGMGIPVGKIALYTTCAGIHPRHCLPVLIDVGTNTESLLQDDFYIGLRQRRDRSQKYDDLIDEFITAAKDVFGRTVLLQFEDFGNANAFRLLQRYRESVTCFNDDIQGTAAVVLAGVHAALPLCVMNTLSSHIFLFFGAGEAGVGIGELISSAIARETGSTIEEARRHCWFVDRHGLIVNTRIAQLESHKVPFAHNLPHTDSIPAPTTLLDAIRLVKPTALIGVAGQGNVFTEEIIRTMTAINTNVPLIFALSNPTSKSECTAEDCYRWSDGRAVFASGSPFAPVTLSNGYTVVPGQCNNSYIFPGMGLAAVLANACCLCDEDFLVAAEALSECVQESRLQQGCCYPELCHIRQVSAHIAIAVAKSIHKSGRSSDIDRDIDWEKRCVDYMYVPDYDRL